MRDASETVELIKKEGVEGRSWQLDSTDDDAVRAAVDQVEKEVGQIRVLVNCVGISGSRPVMMENYKNFRKTMDTNIGAVILYLCLLS